MLTDFPRTIEAASAEMNRSSCLARISAACNLSRYSVSAVVASLVGARRARSLTWRLSSSETAMMGAAASNRAWVSAGAKLPAECVVEFIMNVLIQCGSDAAIRGRPDAPSAVCGRRGRGGASIAGVPRSAVRRSTDEGNETYHPRDMMLGTRRNGTISLPRASVPPRRSVRTR
jgi:hypothetical protein